MFLSHRHITFPELGAAFHGHVAVTRTFRLRVAEQTNLIVDDALTWRKVERKGRLERPIVSVLLAGRAGLRVNGVERLIEPGEMTAVHCRTDLSARQEGTFRTLFIEWEGGPLGTRRPQGFDWKHVSSRELAILVQVADVISSDTSTERQAAEAVCCAMNLLRACGAPLDPVSPADLIEPVHPGTRNLSSALDKTLSSLTGQPAMIDLETLTGLSDRQLTRLVTEFNGRYGYNATNWRDTLKRWRLLAGTIGMTAPGATTDYISRVLGYSSPTAFCRSLADAGLPSPGMIPKIIRNLGL